MKHNEKHGYPFIIPNTTASIRDGVSILIPTWNNLPYLKLCVDSLRRFSRLDNEIILHINDGSDGTLEYAKEEGLKYTHTKTNVGLCKGINECARLASKRFIIYFNDDMFALPDWDREIDDFIVRHGIPDLFWACSMLIEGFGANPDFIAGSQYNFGRTPDTFDEARMIARMDEMKKVSVGRAGTTWAPCLIPTEAWNQVGGFTEDFDKAGGFGSDPDLAKKMWDIGCRNYFSVPTSLTYHFGSIVTRRHSKDVATQSRPIFESIHGMSIEHFVNNILHRGREWKGVE